MIESLTLTARDCDGVVESGVPFPLAAAAILIRYMSDVVEIAPDVYRVCVYAPEINLQFNHFLVKDDEPLLFHTGLRGMFPAVREAVSRLIDPAKIRHISFSHFESDECGSLNSWLEIAPNAEPVCGLVGALVSVNDFATRPARALTREDTFATGKYRFRFIPTPHVPHGWDAGVMLEETRGTLFCSDLFHQWGEREPLTRDSLIERARETLIQSEAGPFANYVPYTHHTGRILEDLANFQPRTLATMHGSSFEGDAASEIRGLAGVMRDVLGPKGA
jgi:flavorubredoxin